MRPAIRAVLLLSIGAILALLVTWLLGWLSAISLPAGLVTTVAKNEILASLVYVIGMRVLPAGLLAVAFGLLTIASVSASRLTIVGLCSLPWIGFAVGSAVAIPYTQATGIFERMQVLLSWQLWPVILSVPVGLLLATTMWRDALSPGGEKALPPHLD